MEEVDFRKLFVEEAGEIIQELENALMQLEKNPKESGFMHEIFRHMHSLKGSGAMFGFQQLSNFAHYLESLFDVIRNHPSLINQKIFDLTFRSVDFIKKMLAAPDNQDLVPGGKELTATIQSLIASLKEGKEPGSGVTEAAITSTKTASEKKPAPEPDEVIATWLISFIPDQDVMINGTNPLYLLDELLEYGKGLVRFHPEQIPDMSSMDPKKCYGWWEILLVTTATEQTLLEVFLFVEDSGELSLHEIGHGDLLENPSVKASLEEMADSEPMNLLDLQEILAGKQAVVETTGIRTIGESDSPSTVEKTKAVPTIRVASEKLDTLMNLVSEFVSAQARLDLYAEQNGDPVLLSISEGFHKLSRRLRDNTFDIFLIPVDNLVTKFNRLVRDLSQQTGKEIRFVTSGTETELDKTIIERLNEPLLHLLRNCIDHGIEMPEERKSRGKNVVGEIFLKAYYSGTYVYIEGGDDGAGIDPEKIRKKGIEHGWIKPEEQPNEKALYELLFKPGFSTSKEVTDLSGRGVGLDVVREKIQELRGNVEIASGKDEGTTFILQIPLTLSIMDGFLLQVGSSRYILPIASVVKIYELLPQQTDHCYQNVITLDGKQIPFFDLRKEFKTLKEETEIACLINVQHEGREIGLIVDQILGSYQAVLKPMGKYLKNQDIFSGAAILGDGAVALVLDPNKLISRYAEEK